MRRGMVSIVATLAAVAFTSNLLAIDIQVSPNVINIQSESTVVTVHTDIAYGLVDVADVTLNGIEISSYKADLRGNFVAKFEASAIKGIVSSGNSVELVLSGFTKTGAPFTGSQDVKVIDVGNDDDENVDD